MWRRVCRCFWWVLPPIAAVYSPEIQHRPTPSRPTTLHGQGRTHVHSGTPGTPHVPQVPILCTLKPPLNIEGLNRFPDFYFLLTTLPDAGELLKWVLTQCLRSRAYASLAMHSLYRKDCESIAHQPILLRRPTLSPFSTLLRLTYRLYRSLLYEDSALPP